MSEARPGRAAPGAGDEDFPLLDELIRAHPNHLLKPSLNPRRDLACLITLDTNNASGQASAAGAGAGPGGALNAHQAARARLIAMARARALGGAAAAAAAAAGQTVGAASSTGEPKRGPSVLVSLFRTQGAVFRVWQVSVPVQPSLFEARKTSDGKFIEEEERVAVGDVAWSPDGTRLALSLTFTRTTPASAAGPSSQAVQSRHAHLLQILSVENGVQLSAIATGTRPAALEKVGKPQNANMPHYMRAQQQLAGIGSAGATAQQAIDRALPSEQARLTGVGPLARLGSLYGPGEVLESGLWGRKGGGGGKAKGGAAASVGPSSNSSLGKRSEDRELSLLCAVEAVEEEREGDLPSSSSSTHLDFVLDGTVSIGSVQIGNDSTDIWRPASFTFSSDVRFASLSLTNNITGTLRPIVLHLPFTPSSSYDVSTTTSTHSPPAVQLLKEVPPPTLFHPTLHLSQLASYLRLYLAYALDAATLCSRMWAAETGRGKRLSYGVHGLPVPETAKKDSAATGTGGTAEWGRLLREAASNEGADIIADLLVVLLTGRASTAMESLLLNTVTQGMMRNMEASSTDTLSHIRSLCGDSILPACERVRLLLSEVRGCARWSQRFGALFPRAEEGHPTAHVEALSELHRLSELAIELCRRVVKQAERELLVLDEFYKWWRFERERQDYLRTHKTDPLLAIVHDVLSVSEFVHRGLVNPQLAAYLDGGKVSVAAVVLPSRPSGLGINMVDDSTEASAVLDSRGRVTMQKADSTPADAFPAVDEVMQSVDPVPTRTLQQTLANLKVRVLENRQMGSSIAPRRPLPTRQNQAARLRARELFLGPATDFGDGNGDGDGDGRDALTGRTLEGMLWQLVNGVADVIDPALRRSMGAYTGVQDGDELAT
ncbi:unnamed protein product [Tilletia laevis]|nr:unnamed protein product [Tilletia laevis]